MGSFRKIVSSADLITHRELVASDACVNGFVFVVSGPSASRLRIWVRSAHFPVLRADSSAVPPWVRSLRFARPPVASFAEFLTNARLPHHAAESVQT